MLSSATVPCKRHLLQGKTGAYLGEATMLCKQEMLHAAGVQRQHGQQGLRAGAAQLLILCIQVQGECLQQEALT